MADVRRHCDTCFWSRQNYKRPCSTDEWERKCSHCDYECSGSPVFTGWQPVVVAKSASIQDVKTSSILIEADALVSGDRAAAYGDCTEDYRDVAALWSVVLHHTVTAREAALCMCLVKLRREAHQHKRDNLVDLCGYAHIAQKCAEKETGA